MPNVYADIRADLNFLKQRITSLRPSSAFEVVLALIFFVMANGTALFSRTGLWSAAGVVVVFTMLKKSPFFPPFLSQLESILAAIVICLIYPGGATVMLASALYMLHAVINLAAATSGAGAGTRSRMLNSLGMDAGTKHREAFPMILACSLLIGIALLFEFCIPPNKVVPFTWLPFVLFVVLQTLTSSLYESAESFTRES